MSTISIITAQYLKKSDKLRSTRPNPNTSLHVNIMQWCSPRDRGLGLETARGRFLSVLVLVLVLTLPVLVLVSALPVLVLDLVSKDWSRVFFVTSHVSKMPTGASSRTAAEHILSAHLTVTSWTVHLHRRSHDPHSLHLTRRQPLQHWLPSHPASAPAFYATGIHPGSVWTSKCQLTVWRPSLANCNDQFKCLRRFVTCDVCELPPPLWSASFN